jgi:hypothetical protein
MITVAHGEACFPWLKLCQKDFAGSAPNAEHRCDRSLARGLLNAIDHALPSPIRADSVVARQL